MADRVILDCMVYDAVAQDRRLKQLIEQCQRVCSLFVLSTHVETDQLAAIPADKDIGQANAVSVEPIPTPVCIIDHSRIDRSRIGTDALNAAYTKLRIGNPKHTDDAIIGTTAVSDADILVTDDKGFRNRFKKLRSSVRVMSSAEFATYLEELLKAAPACPRP